MKLRISHHGDNKKCTEDYSTGSEANVNEFPEDTDNLSGDLWSLRIGEFP